MRYALALGLASLTLLLAPTLPARADAYSEAVALLDAMNARARYEEAFDQLERQTGIELEADEARRALMNRIFDEMARIYAEVYTAEELAAIRAFFESAAGQAFLAKTPLLTQKYMEIATTLVGEEFE
jgi:hypothetical protein